MLKIKNEPTVIPHALEDYDEGTTIQDVKGDIWIKLDCAFRCLTAALKERSYVDGKQVTVSLVVE